MKADLSWKVIVGVAFVTLSLLLMTIHFLIFQDSHYLFIYLLADLAFIPVEVLCVTLIIDSLLTSRERQQRMEKLNMVIGIFFSRVGTPLIGRFVKADTDTLALRAQMAAGPGGWTGDRFRAVGKGLASWKCAIDPGRVDRDSLREFLIGNEAFLLSIVENPMVFEHESFTDLILALTHLYEELKARGDLTRLPPSDIAHLMGDMERVYSRLVPEWLKYMEYLERSYPYLFSLALRTNPFNEAASVVVE